MGKGGMRGVGTVISPHKNPDWFTGHDEEDEGPFGPRKNPVPLSPEIEQEIASLRRSIPALENKMRQVEADLASEKRKLQRILLAHGQPLDDRSGFGDKQ